MNDSLERIDTHACDVRDALVKWKAGHGRWPTREEFAQTLKSIDVEYDVDQAIDAAIEVGTIKEDADGKLIAVQDEELLPKRLKR